MAIKKNTSILEPETTKLTKIKMSANDLTKKKSTCCTETTSCAEPVKSHFFKTDSTTQHLKQQPNKKTRIIIKYDAGFGNSLSIRGKGANLSWDKGSPIKNVSPNEWIFETDLAFSTVEFKTLINDQYYESGNNHTLTCGATIEYTPQF